MDIKEPTAAIVSMRNIKRQVLGLELLRTLGTHGRRIFTTETVLQMAKEVGLSPKEVPATLTHLQEEGWIVLLRRGLYAIWCSLPTTASAHPFEIALALTSPAVISYWSALHHYSLVTKASPYVYVLTHTGSPFPRQRGKDRVTPPGTYAVGELLFFFVQIKPERLFGIKNTKVETAEISLTELERTLLDAVAQPQYCGGWTQVHEAFSKAFERIDTPKLVNYALQGDVATAKRAGWLLEQFNVDSRMLDPLLQAPIKGFRRLDPSAPAGGSYNKRWQLQINSRNEKSGAGSQESE